VDPGRGAIAHPKHPSASLGSPVDQRVISDRIYHLPLVISRLPSIPVSPLTPARRRHDTNSPLAEVAEIQSCLHQPECRCQITGLPCHPSAIACHTRHHRRTAVSGNALEEIQKAVAVAVAIDAPSHHLAHVKTPFFTITTPCHAHNLRSRITYFALHCHFTAARTTAESFDHTAPAKEGCSYSLSRLTSWETLLLYLDVNRRGLGWRRIAREIFPHRSVNNYCGKAHKSVGPTILHDRGVLVPAEHLGS
jgi:hypothetical protein